MILDKSAGISIARNTTLSNHSCDNEEKALAKCSKSPPGSESVAMLCSNTPPSSSMTSSKMDLPRMNQCCCPYTMGAA